MRFLNIVLIFSLFIAIPALGEDIEDIIVSYPIKEGVYYTESQPGVFQLRTDGNYEVLAYIRPVTKKKERIFNKYQIDLAKILKKDNLSVQTEITDEGLLILNKEGHSGKDEIKFTLPLPEKGIDIEEYPFFQIRYQELNPFSPVEIRGSFSLDVNGDGKVDTTVFAKAIKVSEGKLVKSIDFSKATFVPKTYSYLLYRKLGIKRDEEWRYIQDKENCVIQRRFYEDIREVPVIKLFFDKKYKVNRINFMVDFNNNERPDATIEFERTVHRCFSQGELEVMEIDLLKSVKKLFPKEKNIFLTEIFIFVQGNKDNILKEMPLKELGFYQWDVMKMEKELHLVEADLKEKKQEKYLTIDLSKLEKENIYLAKVKKAQLILDFSKKNVPAGIILKDARFYNAFEENSPVFLNLFAQTLDKRNISTQALAMPKMKFCQDFSISSRIAFFSKKNHKDNFLNIIPHNTHYQLYRTEKGTKIKFYFNGDRFERENLIIEFPFLSEFLRNTEELRLFYETHGKIKVYALLRYKNKEKMIFLQPNKAVISLTEMKKPLSLNLVVVPEHVNCLLYPTLGEIALKKIILKTEKKNHLISFEGANFFFPKVKKIYGWEIKSPVDIEIENTPYGLKISYQGKNFPNVILKRDLDIKIDKDTYFWCDYKALNIVPHLNLIWEEKGKEIKKKFIISSALPLKLGNKVTEGKIKKVILSLKPIEGSFDNLFKKHWFFVLKRIEFFDIKPIKNRSLLESKLPPSENLIPLLFTKISPSSKKCLVWNEKNNVTAIWQAFSSSPLNLSLRCDVNKKVQSISYLSFNYKGDPGLLKINPCWLKIILGVQKNKKLKKFVLRPCLTKSNGSVIIRIKEKILEKTDSDYLSWVDFEMCFEKIPAFKIYSLKINDVCISEFKGYSIIETVGKGILGKIDKREITAESILRTLLKDEDFLNGGAWVSLGKFFFSKGEHTVEFTSHPYLKIDTLLLKAQNPIPVVFPSSAVSSTPLSEKILGLGIKIIGWSSILLFFYLIYRFRHIYLPFWDKFNKVWEIIPIKVKFIIFPVLGLCFYILGLKKGVGHGENYLFTSGGIFFAFGYHYLCLFLKPWWLKHYEKIGSFLYKSSGSIYIIGFMITLIIAALFLVFGIEPLADQVAIIGYYLLVASVIKEFLKFRQST